MTPLVAPFAVSAVLMAGAGCAKLASPQGTAGALAALRLPDRKLLVRTGGAVEALVALFALTTGRAALAGVVALSYLLFAGFVIAALRANTAVSSCGCLGRRDTPPHIVHVVLNLLASGVALAAAARGGIPGLGEVIDAQPWSGVPFLIGVGVGAALASVAMSRLPQTLRLAKGLV
jgi:hypothetical protein